MDFGFSDEQDAIREALSRLLGEHATMAKVHERIESGEGFDRETWSALAAGGWLAIAIPQADGGAGMGAVELAVLAEEIGRSLAAVPFAGTLCLAVPALLAHATPATQRDVLPRIAAGEMIVAVALAHDGALAPESLGAHAAGGRLSGRTGPVADVHAAERALVAAAGEDGAAGLYLVDLTGPGVRVDALDPIDRSRPMGRLLFEGAPAEPLAGADAAAIERLKDGAAVLCAFEQIGLAERAVAMTAEYARERKAFGRPIGGFQAVKHRLADAFAKIELARSNAFFGVWALASADPRLPEAAACARLSALDAAAFATEEAIQLHGGIGFTWAADPHLYLRRSWHLKALLGPAPTWRERLVQALAPSALPTHRTRAA